MTDSILSLVGYGLLIAATGFAVGMAAAALTNKLWDKFVPVPIDSPATMVSKRIVIPHAWMP